MMNNDAPVIFALHASHPFGEMVARHLGTALSAHEEREFEDGEHKSRALVSVRARDVFVIQSLYGDVQGCTNPLRGGEHRTVASAATDRTSGGTTSGTKEVERRLEQPPRATQEQLPGRAGATDTQQSVNDKLVRLLFFIGALKDASAARVTAVVPYLAYARKDAKTQTRDPVTTRYVAQLFEAAGTDRVITMDVHNLAAFQNAFRCHTDHLEATKLFVTHFASLLKDAPQITVVSPDIGGMKRAERFRQALGRSLNRELNVAFLEKTRAKGAMRTGRLVGEVAGTAIIIDDLISTGGTLLHAAAACREKGAKKVYAAASHGIFVGSANRLLSGTELDQVVITDTIQPLRLDPELAGRKLTVLSAAPLFAEAIRRIHTGGSLVELLEI